MPVFLTSHRFYSVENSLALSHYPERYSTQMHEHKLRKMFAAAIKAHRSQQDLSQQELADKAGLHRTYISDIERGMRNPSLDVIEQLAVALNVQAAELFKYSEDIEKSSQC